MSEVTLHLGDCLEYMRTMPDGCVDAVITDPPYGVNFQVGDIPFSRRGANVRFVRTKIIGDNRPFDPVPFLEFPIVVLFGANNFANKLPPSRGWIFWHKRPNMESNDFGDGELIWTNQDHVLIYYKHMWNGVLRDTEVGEEHYHPTQKPVAIMRFLLQRYTLPGQTIFDPFMGSSPLGIACVQLQRNYIGCEIDPGYFEIAKKRIAQAQAQPQLFIIDQPKAVQDEMEL